MERLAELIKQERACKAQKDVFYGKYKELATKQAELLQEIKSELIRAGTKKYETLDDKYLVTIKDNAPTFDILDEKATIGWLKRQENVDVDMMVGIRKDMFTPYARTILKSTGEVIDGTRINVSQTVLIKERENKKKTAAQA